MTRDQIKQQIAAMRQQLDSLTDALENLLDEPEQDTLDNGTNEPDETPEDTDTEEDTNGDEESDTDTDDAEGQDEEDTNGDEGEPSESESTPQDTLGNETDGTSDRPTPGEETSTGSDLESLADDDRPTDDDTRPGTQSDGDNAPQDAPEESEIDTDDEETETAPSPYAGAGAGHNDQNNGNAEASDGTAEELTSFINYAPPADTIPPAVRPYWSDALEYQVRNAIVNPCPPATPGTVYAIHNDEANKDAATLRQYIASNLSVPPRTIDGLETGYRSGELDEAEVWQIATGIDDATPFARRTTENSPELVVGIIVDCSGSMSAYDNMHHARTLATAIHQAITDKELTCHVWGFSEGYCADSPKPSEEAKSRAMARQSTVETQLVTTMGEQYRKYWIERFFDKQQSARLEHTLYGNSVLKIYETEDPATGEFNAHPCQAGGNNPDGAAILWAARRLREQHADAQAIVLIQISDGQPARAQVHDTWIGQEWGEMQIAEEEARSLGVQTLHIGVGAAFKQPDVARRVDTVFRGNHVPVAALADSAPAIVAMLQRAISDI